MHKAKPATNQLPTKSCAPRPSSTNRSSQTFRDLVARAKPPTSASNRPPNGGCMAIAAAPMPKAQLKDAQRNLAVLRTRCDGLIHWGKEYSRRSQDEMLIMLNNLLSRSGQHYVFLILLSTLQGGPSMSQVLNFANTCLHKRDLMQITRPDPNLCIFKLFLIIHNISILIFTIHL
jgi:hypothetical protein